MWSFRDKKAENRRTVLTFTAGAAGGLLIGALFSGRGAQRQVRGMAPDLRTRVGQAASRISPARQFRTRGDETELSQLEDSVLDAFLNHEFLRERGIDVGAISRGIIELSGSVRTEEEADEAVRIANRIPNVQTVVNRLEIESEREHLDETRRRFEGGDAALQETRWTGRVIGMGRMRQGAETEPDRRDDSQWQQERALRNADRDQWQQEGFAAKNSRMSARPEDTRPGKEPDFEHDDLDNQDPHRRHHAPETLDEQPQDLRTDTRVGEGLKPGTELRLEDADVPLKPHSDITPVRDEDREG